MRMGICNFVRAAINARVGTFGYRLLTKISVHNTNSYCSFAPIHRELPKHVLFE